MKLPVEAVVMARLGVFPPVNSGGLIEARRRRRAGW